MSEPSAEPAILVVEDDRLLRRMTVETLTGEGLAAVGADGGEASLDMMAAHDGIRLLITDINMPGMSGLQLLAIVRDRYPAMKRMVISGRPFLAPDCLPPGTHLLAKPFTATQFLARVRTLLAPAGN